MGPGRDQTRYFWICSQDSHLLLDTIQTALRGPVPVKMATGFACPLLPDSLAVQAYLNVNVNLCTFDNYNVSSSTIFIQGRCSSCSYYKFEVLTLSGELLFKLELSGDDILGFFARGSASVLLDIYQRETKNTYEP